jgi:hypothetical protein
MRMRRFLSALLVAGLGNVANAGEISSVYTDLVAEKDCVTYAAAAGGEGDWANMACAGYRGYPVLLAYDDARESIFYGFAPASDLPWESFSAFNSAGPKIEWRLESNGDQAVPFAAIQRWSVSDPEDPDNKIEVLVVSKVAQMKERDGCVVGLVVGSGNPKANDTARRIADEQTRNFACGADERVQVSGEIPLPEFSRAENN